MKKLLISLLVLSGIAHSYSETIPADTILQFVRTQLPSDPLKLTGELQRIAKNGHKTTYPVVMDLNWGTENPTAQYQIGKESLNITWKNDVPNYAFSNARNTPTSDILDTGMTWADLSFSVLWWPDAKLIDEEKKLNRECYVVDVPVPDSENTMRLWIEKKMGMLMEAHTLGPNEKKLRRLKIRSIKKMDGMWVAKDLELTNYETGRKTNLRISDLEWKKPQLTATAFDPAVSVNTLTFDLYKRLAEKDSENLFLSPYSISSALAMVYGGAHGETANQMETTLHFGGQGATHPAFSVLRRKLNGIQKTGNVELNIANSLWPQKDYTFSPDYLTVVAEFYGREIVPVDFRSDTEGARIRINTWVEKQTNERIKDLIPEGMLDPMTRLVLANAIYFKGRWATQFESERTRPAPFMLADGTPIEVPTMMQTGDFKLASANTFQALELPYEGEELAMVILLPNEKNGLTALEESLSAEQINGLPFKKQEVFVQLPRFKLEWKFELSKTLTAMGMPLAFSDQADLSGMDGSKDLSIGFVVHQAFVEVNEEGTEAAAATAVGIRTTSMPPMFEANHPFLFLIREHSTGTILFIGRVTDPR